MFFDWKGIVMVLAALCAVILLCAVDLRCSARPNEGSTIARVKGELAAGRKEVHARQAEDLTRMVRDMRVMAKKYVKEGDMKNARRAMAAVQELEKKIKLLRGEK